LREDEHLRRRFIENRAAYSDIASELGRPLGEVVERARELNLWDEYCAKKLSELKTTMLPKDGSKCLCGADVFRDGRFCSSCGRPIR
jgi:hypothetical protein